MPYTKSIQQIRLIKSMKKKKKMFASFLWYIALKLIAIGFFKISLNKETNRNYK